MAKKGKKEPTAGGKQLTKIAKKKTKPGQAKRNIDLLRAGPLRGVAARLEFIMDVANAAKKPVCDVRKFLDGMRIALGRNLAENKYTNIPGIMNLRIGTLRERKAEMRLIKGKMWLTKAIPERRKVFGGPVKRLSDALV